MEANRRMPSTERAEPIRASYCITRSDKLKRRRGQTRDHEGASPPQDDKQNVRPIKLTPSELLAAGQQVRRTGAPNAKQPTSQMSISKQFEEAPAKRHTNSARQTADTQPCRPGRDERVGHPLASSPQHRSCPDPALVARKPPTSALARPLIILALCLLLRLAQWPENALTRLAGGSSRTLVAAQQYAPNWPQKLIEQEIFLLNLEDGYFGCQVNASQDFLQLFELSRLCDGQPQCYLGSDELASQLKCRERDRCELSSSAYNSSSSSSALLASQPSSAGPPESVRCVNGVCLDGLCYCNDGFGGKSCDIPDENECKFRPCDVFAHCTNTMGSYYCSCFPGYDGDGMHCQDINECEIPSLRALCADNSECVNLPGHFVCKCKSGYQQAGQPALTGAPIGNATVQCTDIDECSLGNACGKGATCENLPGSFRCACPPGFTGDPAVECIDMDECRHNPCGLGAQCTNVPGGFKCACAPGHERNPAAPAALFNSIQFLEQQQLLELTNSSQLTCLDINECAAATQPGKAPPCGQAAQCVNTPGGFFCQCPTGFTGNPKVACVDIDECAAHACGPNAQCRNTPGSYKCECKPGYTGNAYLTDGCQDEDECLRKDACGLNAQCFNTLGSFQCTCQSGFAGDPYRKCADIDECQNAATNPCGPGAQCQNLDGGYKCTCPEKFLARGTPEMGCERAAVDIGCAGDFDCTQNAQCLNGTCQCKLGYQASGIECVDVDECAALSFAQPEVPVKAFTRLNAASLNVSSTLCGPEASCHNTQGGYRCECRPGYEPLEPQSATSKCRDINECERTPCGPNSKCFNTDGAFKCACNDAFIPIEGDPANGCKSPCEGVNCGQHATCKPHGEEAACVCKPGFTFDPNNIKLGCVDINECDTNYGPSGLCGQRATCTNVPGSYRCACPAGYAGDAYRYCEDINECDRKFGVFGQCGELAVCTNKPGSFACACAPGYSGDPKSKCADVDECSSKFGPSGKCGLNAICTNSPGKFSCACPPNHTGDPNVKCTPEQPACSSAADCSLNQLCQSGRCVCPFAADGGVPGGECRHPCDRTECGAHATCQLDSDNQPLCVCDSGFMAPSDGRSGCVDVNECIQGVTLSGVTPLSALNSGGSVALGTAQQQQQTGNATSGGHPCGRNALCRNQPGSFDCVCPPGYSGDAYVACSLDVRNQQQPITTTTTTITTTTSGALSQTSNSNQQQQQQQQQTTTTTAAGGELTPFGNYQQEPRTTACSEPCARNHVCSDGQCVRRDACRDHQDCRPTQACQPVSQALGFQCVAVCDSLGQPTCGPNAVCQASNHKAVCSCNSTLFAGNPYDLTTGCQRVQLAAYDDLRQTTQSHLQTSSGLNEQQQKQFSQSSATKLTEGLHRTTLSSSQGDISTVSFDYAPGGHQQPLSTTSDHGVNSANSAAGQTNEQHQVTQQLNSGRQPNQPLIAYELPLQTTPFDVGQFGATKSTTSEQQQQQQQNLTATTQQQQQLFTQEQRETTSQPAFSRQQSTTSSPTTTTNLFSLKRKPSQQHQQQQQQLSSAGNERQNDNNNNNNNNNSQQSFEQRQDIQVTTTTKSSSQQQQVTEQNSRNQVTNGADAYDQFSNKSAVTQTHHTTNVFSSQYKQVACTSDQHCPGNLFCLSPSDEFAYSAGKSSQKVCGCPLEYGRDGDYCFMHRVNCTTSNICKAREECVQSSLSSSPFRTTSISQQFAGSQQEDYTTTAAISTGVCICPRGYKLTLSGLACIDRNECDEGTPCALGAVCQNKIGSYECVCPPGTVGEPYTKTCEPIVRDECRSNDDCALDRECDLASRKCVSPCHICGPRAICTATNHAAICLCPPRFTGNAIDQVYGCQEPPQPPPTTTLAPPPPPPTTQTPARPPTTAVGVPITTLLPASSTTSTTSAPSLETTTVDQPEYRTIPPTELFVMCLADGIHVDLQLEKFDGIIYVKGHSQDPKCRKLVMSNGSPNQMVDFKVQFGHCDLIHRDGEAGFVLVIQKHPKLVTYRARAYHVKCVYNTGERTVTLGFNVSMITTSGTIANTGPPPTCLMSITALDGREITSAEIGQDLLLRVDVQPDAIYGGFARSCEAKTMDDEGEYQYEVTDANGCATDPSIFSDWKYDQHRKSLVARFNAFKFPSSNNLRFQCNIRVCFGSCPAVNCNGIDAYGKRRKRRAAPAISGPNSTIFSDDLDPAPNDDDETLTEELVVSDKSFKDGALREEIMVQSNAILTFDKKEASLPQQRPPVEDIEFVCWPKLGIVLSILLTLLLALLALAVATSCWCFASKRNNKAKPAPIQVRREPTPNEIWYSN